MKRIIILVVMSLMLSSCDTIGKLMPSLGYSKDNQSTTSADTLSQSIGHASVSLTAGTNKTKSYGDKSNIKSSDLNLDTELNQSTSATNLGGVHSDNSNKVINSTTKKDNKDTRYNASHQVVYNRTPLLNWIVMYIAVIIPIFILFYAILYLGQKIGMLKIKVADAMRKRRIKRNEIKN